MFWHSGTGRPSRMFAVKAVATRNHAKPVGGGNNSRLAKFSLSVMSWPRNKCCMNSESFADTE